MFIFYIVSLAVAVFAAWLYGRSSDQYVQQVRLEAQTQLDIETKRIEAGAQEREAKIKADAEVKIAEAHAIGEQANERAGKANERAEQIAGENLKLRTDLENATAESRAKQAELAREQQKLTKEQQKTALAQKEAAEAILESRRYLSQVRSLQTPRRFTTKDRAVFIAVLKSQPVGAIDILWTGDFFVGEPEHFAKEIAEALKEAGWTVNKMQGVIMIDDEGGVRIVVRDLKKLPPRALALNNAFFESGFVIEFLANKKLGNDDVLLSVSRIPVDGGWILRPPQP